MSRDEQHAERWIRYQRGLGLGALTGEGGSPSADRNLGCRADTVVMVQAADNVRSKGLTMLQTKRRFWPYVLLTLTCGLFAATAGAQPAIELEGYVPEISTEKLFFKGTYYLLVKGDADDIRTARWPQATECHMRMKGAAPYQVTCGTLAQVGYIGRARLRIELGKVSRVEVIELMQ